MKAVIFDMDGVLVNTEPLHFRCWREVFLEDGFEIDYDSYKPCIGSTQGFLLELIRKKYGRSYEDEKKMKDRMREKKLEIVKKEGYPAVDGVKEVLARLKAEGYLLAVASSSPLMQIEETLQALGLDLFFDCFTSGEKVENPKPAPDTFLESAGKLGILPKDCLVVEDSTNGGKAAAAAGMQCVWFHNPDSGEQEIPHAILCVEKWDENSVKQFLECVKQ